MDPEIDQVLMSASVAMSFALRHWEHFCECVPSIIKGPVPITEDQMRRHAEAVMNMVNEKNLPE